MTQGRYATTVERHGKQRSRKRKMTIGAIVGVLILAVASIAVGIYLSTARVSGGGSSAKFVASFTPSGTAACAGATASVTNGVLDVQLPSTMPGDPGCAIDANITLGDSTRSGYVTGVILPGLPVGWHAELLNGTCGKTLNPGTPAGVAFRLFNDSDASGVPFSFTAGSGIQVAALGAGVTSAPAGVTCPAYTPAA